MDVAKAKNIIIVVLLIFNLLLLYNNVMHSETQAVSKDVTRNTEQILMSKGVKLECEIPSDTNGTNRLRFSTEPLDRQQLAKKLMGDEISSSRNAKVYESDDGLLEFIDDYNIHYVNKKPGTEIDLNKKGAAKNAAKAFLKSKGLWENRYIVDDLTNNSDGSVTVSFTEEYNDLLIFDNYCNVIVTSEGISNLFYGRHQIIQFSSEVEDKLYAHQALLSYFSEANYNCIITNIDMGYKIPDEESQAGNESSEMSPVWRIRIKGADKPVYLD